ncbi:hypothetical protein PybrP1_002825 [[Pythium] brassicae (nom. inval.)]|nr:hypothetical protein PybrP1_002825 [[Pythium] brassicae (nom. inval.)]
MEQPPTDAQLRRRYVALLQHEAVVDENDALIESDYARWRELKRMVIAFGLPRDEAAAASDADPCGTTCSLRGRIWKLFLGVDAAVDREQYAALAARGASPFDGDIRNDTFRTFRGDPAFAQRVPEEKLARLLNVFINELGTGGAHDASQVGEGHPEHIRYVQGMNILCAPLLYVMPEADAYYTFRQLVMKHCPHYMAPRLQGVESGCLLVDKCLQTLDVDLFHHLKSRGITARIYALPLVLSLFACAPPLHELLRVWDVLFAVGVHFVVVLAVAHTVLLREQLLHKDMDLMKILSLRFAPPLQSELLVSVALQLLHRLPDELIYEIARHPFEYPESASSLPLSPETIEFVLTEIWRQQQEKDQRQAAQGTRFANAA